MSYWDWLIDWKRKRMQRLVGNQSLKYKQKGWGYEERHRRDRIDFAHSKRKKEHCPDCRFDAVKEKWKFPRWKRKRRSFSMRRCWLCGFELAEYGDRYECLECGHVYPK